MLIIKKRWNGNCKLFKLVLLHIWSFQVLKGLRQSISPSEVLFLSYKKMWSVQDWDMGENVLFPKLVMEVLHAPFWNGPLICFYHTPSKKCLFFCKLSKITCDICVIKTLVEGGANSIYCKNYDHKMFVK